jgi:hypothetical protein
MVVLWDFVAVNVIVDESVPMLVLVALRFLQ